MKTLPRFLKQYFWDVDFRKIDGDQHPKDVIGRILEYGDEKAARWMVAHFTRKEIADVLYHYRLVSPKSANFWALIFGVDRKRVLCLQKRYLRTLRSHWPY